MRFNKLHTCLSLLCVILVACNREDVLVHGNPEEKSPILISVGDNNIEPITKAIVIDGHGYITAFENDTRLHLLMISEDSTTPSPAPTEYTVTYAKANGSGNPPSSTTDGTESTVSFASGDGIARYWDDTHARNSVISIYGLATANTVQVEGAPWFQKLCGVGTGWANSGYETNAFVGTKTNPSVPWSTNPDPRFGTFIGANTTTSKWIIGDNTQSNNYTVQTMTSMLSKDDLCYSNNIADYRGQGGDDNRLIFDPLTKKFRHGTMVFHRAMTLFTIKLYPGRGFDSRSADNFQFNKNAQGKATNIMLKGFNKSGYLNIKDGTWSQVDTGDWVSIDNTDYGNPNISGVGPYWTLMAFVIPGTDMTTTVVSDAMSFIIDNNYFKLSMQDLYNAIKDNPENCSDGVVKNTVLDGGTKLKQGINYEFSLTLSKTEITNLTAQVIDWETVTAEEQTPSNARITLDVEDRSGSSSTSAVTSDMDIYRALDQAPSITDDYVGYNWAKGYNVDGKAKWQGNTLLYNNDRWSTDWYWESNKTYYHFRTLSPTSQVVTTDATYGDYTSITSASCAADSYNAMAWGSPFKNVDPTYKFTYSTRYGFDGKGAEATEPVHQLYQAIGPVKDHENNPIKVLMFHMFSGVHFTVKTSDAADKVILAKAKGTDPETYTRTRVDLVKYYPQGKVRLGTGYIDPDGTLSSVETPWNVEFASADNDTEYVPQQYYFSAVPQDLTNVQLYITTPDDNQYIVDLKDAKATTISTTNIENPYKQNGGKYIIDRWYPGFKYNYSFTLRKSGILDLTATVVAWETVDVGDETVVIK